MRIKVIPQRLWRRGARRLLRECQAALYAELRGSSREEIEDHPTLRAHQRLAERIGRFLDRR